MKARFPSPGRRGREALDLLQEMKLKEVAWKNLPTIFMKPWVIHDAKETHDFQRTSKCLKLNVFACAN